MTTPLSSNDDTPLTLKVKPLLNNDRPLKRKFEMQLQGQGLLAFEEALRDRNQTPQQLINDLLEQYLIKEHYLPEWWLSRGRGVN